MSSNRIGYVIATATGGNALVKTGPAALFGLSVLTSATAATVVYDGLTATAAKSVFAKDALTKGDVIHFGGNGVQLGNGLYITCGGTAQIAVLYA